MLRFARPDDQERLIKLASNFHETLDGSYGPIVEDKAIELIEYCSNPTIKDSVLICWEEDENLQGLIAGQATEVLFNRDKVATELIWWVEPAYRKGEAASQLLGAFNYWAEFVGCRYVQMVGLQNDYSKALDRYYKREGFRIAETTYVR